jgi:hypothetical protein
MKLHALLLKSLVAVVALSPAACSASSADLGGHGARPASCGSVLLTNRLSDAKSTVTMTLDGQAFPIELDASADYAKNPVWDADAAPAACGALSDGDKLVTVIQFHQGGVPVLRLQLLGANAGSYQYGVKGDTTKLPSIAGKILDDGPEAMSFAGLEAGTVTITPDTLTSGAKVTIKLAGVKGTTVGGSNPSRTFTLDGEISFTVAQRSYYGV